MKLEDDIPVKDFLLSQEIFTLSLCNQCKSKYTNPRPPKETIGKYYQSIDYISHNSSKINLQTTLYKLIRKYMLYYKYKKIFEYIHKKQILDYGCGNGNFVHYLSVMNENINGYEPNQAAVANANDKIKKLIFDKEEKITATTYEVITLWHVLEHFQNPNEALQKISGCLKNNGLLIIAIPNYQSYDGQKYKEKWAGYDVPRHYTHFSKKGINMLLKNNNYLLINEFPLLFDAYYLSLLSEKNNHHSLPWINALWHGYKSNLEAKKNKNYSSSTYIYQKIK